MLSCLDDQARKRSRVYTEKLSFSLCCVVFVLFCCCFVIVGRGFHVK